MVGIGGSSCPNEFPPYLAREIYLKYCQSGAKILDPCAGWGGRLLGFYSTGLKGEYVATDPSSKTYSGLRNMLQFLKSADSIIHPDVMLHNQPFEDLAISGEYYDFAFTSPPYFDVEMYANDESNQSHNRYQSYDVWCEGFLKPFINKTMGALKPTGLFLVNVSDKVYPLETSIRTICNDSYDVKKANFRLGVDGIGMRSSNAEDGERFIEIRK
jgi:tRNA1(Val) A37 N6-methylase TrmN6